ncbi:hypothetical protein HQ533_01570 [Candidatus Woesearchaeota archaeon]|nr:hypothetical protein [Candidatus Woesearchaeota archaeon]
MTEYWSFNKIKFRLLLFRYNPYVLIITFLLIMVRMIYYGFLFNINIPSLAQVIIVFVSALIIFDLFMELLLDTKLNSQQEKYMSIYTSVLLIPFTFPIIDFFLIDLPTVLIFFSACSVFSLIYKFAKNVRWSVVSSIIYIIIIKFTYNLNWHNVYLSLFILSFFIVYGLRFLETFTNMRVVSERIEQLKKMFGEHKHMKSKAKVINKKHHLLFIKKDVFYDTGEQFLNNMYEPVTNKKTLKELSRLKLLKKKFLELLSDYKSKKYKKKKLSQKKLDIIKYKTHINLQSNFSLIIFAGQLIYNFLVMLFLNRKMMAKMAYDASNDYSLLPKHWQRTDSKLLWKSDFSLSLITEQIGDQEYKVLLSMKYYYQCPSQEYIDFMKEFIKETKQLSKNNNWMSICVERHKLAEKVYGKKSKRLWSFDWPKKVMKNFLNLIEKLETCVY